MLFFIKQLPLFLWVKLTCHPKVNQVHMANTLKQNVLFSDVIVEYTMFVNFIECFKSPT